MNINLYALLLSFLGMFLFSGCSETSTSDAEKNPATSGLSSAEKTPLTLEQRLSAVMKEYYEKSQKLAQKNGHSASPRIDVFDEAIYGLELWTEMSMEPCKYLPEALVFMRSGKSDDNNKYTVLVFTMQNLPLRDYISVWAPAVRDAYLAGKMDVQDFSEAIFPPLTWTDLYKAYDQEPVRSFYASLSNDTRITELTYNEKTTFGEKIADILNGNASLSIKHYQERGAMDVIDEWSEPVDLTTTCPKSGVP